MIRKKLKVKQVFYRIIFFSGIFLMIQSCEKPPENLHDQSETDKWKVFNTSTGLPGNQVRGIFCDSKGNMWFAVSSNGAAKYTDGKWSYINTSNSNIISNGVTCIEEDNKGNILFGTVYGLSFLSTANTWTSYNNLLYITCLKTDSKGKIWVGTSGDGYYVVEGTNIIWIYMDYLEYVNDIEEDSKGNIWIGTDNGLLKWDGKSYTLMTTANGLPDNTITALFSDSRKRLWIGTYFGTTVAMIDANGLHKFSLFNGGEITAVNDICEDSAGKIWFATEGSGLIEYDGVLPYTHKKYNGLPENGAIAAAKDNIGNVWFGLYTKGLTRYSLPIN